MQRSRALSLESERSAISQLCAPGAGCWCSQSLSCLAYKTRITLPHRVDAKANTGNIWKVPARYLVQSTCTQNGNDRAS